MGNIIKVNFDPDKYFIWGIQGLEQWDQGQKLEISGLDISDEIVEVHFSLDEVGGNAKRMLGVVKDGVIHADIPVFVLEGPEHIYGNSDVYSAYAWIYLCDDESAETIRKIEFEIKARPKPEEYVKPDELSFLQQLEQAIKNKITTPTSAKVGQLLRVKTVDENGKPTEFDVVDQSKGAEVTVDNALSEKSTNPVQNQVVTKEVKALKEQNAKLEETVEKLQIKTTTEPSPFHHITDSANMKVLNFGMEGKTEQKTTSGKNYFDIKVASDINNWDTTMSSGGCYIFPIYIGKGNTVTVSFRKQLPLGLGFVLSLDSMGFNSSTHTVYHTNVSDMMNNPCTVTVSDDNGYLRLRVGINEVSTWEAFIENARDNLQIELGEVVTDYEPGTGCKPSPSPDYPQEIVNAGVYNEATGRYEIGCVVVNKNLWDAEYARDANNWYYGSWYPYIKVFVGVGSVVSVSYKQSLEPGITMYSYINSNNTQNGASSIYHKSKGATPKLTITSIDGYIYVLTSSVKYGEEYLNTFMQYIGNDLQIEIANAPTDYNPHQSQILTLTSPVPLTKWDKLVKRDGVWGWSIWQLINTFNGNEDWYINNNNIEGYPVFRYDEIAKALISENEYSMCSHFRHKPGAWSAGIPGEFGDNRKVNDSIYFVTSVVKKGDVAGWKAWLQSNNITVVTKASTEQSFYPLPDEEQELLRNLETYYGVTNLYNDQGCPMWLEYVNDTKLYVDNQIKNAVATTQALILEN